MEEDLDPNVVQPLERPLNLTPVSLKEAALDSPTFRAVAIHFSDQIELVERWLEGYVRAASKLVPEVLALESTINSFLTQSAPPTNLSEAVLDHDYTLLATKRYSEGTRDFWHNTLRGVKRYDATVVEPIKNFLNNDLRSYKDARRNMDNAQKAFDHAIGRHSAQSKTKEASSLREDAFQLYEARKAYLKSCLDFCIISPNIRSSLDKLLVKVFTDHWKEVRSSRDSSASLLTKRNGEMERVKGWSKEMEDSERAFKKELLVARRQIEDQAEQMIKPSRELEDYSVSTVPYLGTGASQPAADGNHTHEKAEKQGWLFLRTITGKPARTVWSRRWFFVQNGIFGWLIQGSRSGGVEESDKTGVLLCSVRPAFNEDRRFCFEVKTNNNSIILQAETQLELTDWIGTFDMAKKKALEDPASSENSVEKPGHDLAFAISPPISPEFAAKVGDGTVTGHEDGTMSPTGPEREGTGLASHASFDVNMARRVTSVEKEAEGTRDHAARLMQRLDLHKRQPASPTVGQSSGSGGIASLIAASHTVLPISPVPLQVSSTTDSVKRTFTLHASSLTPSTLVNPPAATNLSYTAVVVGGEKGIGMSRLDGQSMPSVILANLWGSSNWGYVNRIGGESRPRLAESSPPGSALPISPTSKDDSGVMDGMNENPKSFNSSLPVSESSPHHRKTLSIGAEALHSGAKVGMENRIDDYPPYYPAALKAQNTQFRMLFPSSPRTEMVVLVFRATWNPNNKQEFPGRIYLTEREIYFYSNHLGLVLITEVGLSSISEVTSAPGRDCDFLFLHLKEQNKHDAARRITIKVFLEPLKLLQQRLQYLVANANSEKPANLEDIIQTLVNMESEKPERSSSADGWEEVGYDEDDGVSGNQSSPNYRRERDIKTSLRIDGKLYGELTRGGKNAQKFRLPAHAIVYAPQGMQASISRDFIVGAKALFHVMFGDKSAVFQLLHCNRWADKIVRTPWVKRDDGHWTRTFASEGAQTPMAVTQTVEIFNDHLCYVVTESKYTWRLPCSSRFLLSTKFVITHSAKSRCKLAVFQKVIWQKRPPLAYFRHLIENQALNSLEADALDLTTVAMDQVRKLGSRSKTNEAIEIFGNIGQQLQIAELDTSQTTNLGGTLSARRWKNTQSVSLLRLVLNDILTKVLRLFGLAFDLVMAIGKGILGVFTAHTILVGLLLVSALYNGWNGYRDGVGWYHERSAANFMSRMGVTPRHEMSKALYLSEIDALITPHNIENETLSGISATSGSEVSRDCRTTFSERVVLPPVIDARKPEGVRLRRSREALARHRHDLIVALRVVNRVEKDVLLAEWEEWVRSEERKCDRIGDWLRQRRGEGSTGGEPPGGGDATKYDTEQRDEDLQRYCASCRHEVAAIANGTSLT